MATLPADAKSVLILSGPLVRPLKVSEHVVTPQTEKQEANVVTVSIKGEEIALIVTPNGINFARTATPESFAGKSKLVTWGQARQFIESGELSATRYAVICDGTLYHVCPTRGLADDKASDLSRQGSTATVVPISPEAAERYLR